MKRLLLALQLTMLLSFFVSPCATAQYYGLGINLPLLASGTVNLSFEAAVAPHWSVEIPVMWNPVRTQRLQMKFASVQPGVRYWLFEEYTGHFVGMHLSAAVYNFGNSECYRDG